MIGKLYMVILSERALEQGTGKLVAIDARSVCIVDLIIPNVLIAKYTNLSILGGYLDLRLTTTQKHNNIDK